MKCRSVACIWSGTPTTHRVTAAAALSQPPTLYTGGSDGSILWWTLSSSESDSNLEIKPIAMLCGHAAPIADLGICYPTEVSGDGKAENPSNFMANSSLDNGALISACTDGVLCVWSRSSGHCRRRRRLPPWVGSPSTVCTLPSNPRYVCIGCCFLDAIKLSDHHSFDSVEGDEVSADKEVQNRKAPKCTVVLVDTYGLTIVRTVFHGNLSIGSMKFMAVVPSAEDRGKHSALVIDSFGRLQTVEISKEPESEGEGSTGLHKSPSLLDMSVWADGLVEEGQVVSVATSRNVIAFVLKDRCLFRLLGCGSSIGEISFVDNLFCYEGDSIHSHVIGGMFLESDDAHKSANAKEAHKTFSKNFAVWNNRGSAIVYDISYMNKKFKCEARCEIPAVSNPSNVRYSIYFVQMSLYLLRVESVCFHVEETLQWRPHVTGWSLVQKHGGRGKLCQHSRMVGKGFSFIEWITNSTLPSEIEGSGSDDIISTSRPNADPCAKNGYDKQADGERGSSVLKGKVVSSSMVISENFCAPYAIVYGFFSGEIEVLRFDLFDGLDCSGESPCLGVDSPVCRQYFSGHTAAVLCLAAHRMVGTAKGWNSNQLLVSGSMDCTIRIWDLSTGNLITVMHHHVAPVRQIIFSPPQTQHPWNNCFLSIGEDFCVALASLETLRVERIFPGHPDYPAKVVWDGPRGYIACLCRDHPRTADNNDVLYIWDVKTGAQERVLRGTASHSMFDHFCKGISMNSISGSVLNGNTSVSSLLLPMHEDGSISESHLYNYERGVTFSNITEPGTSQSHVSKGNLGKVYPHTPSIRQRRKQLIKCSSPYPGVAILSFDLASFMFPYQKHESASKESDKQEISSVNELETETPSCHKTLDNGSEVHKKSNESTEEHAWTTSLEEHMLRFSLSFLHLWNVDSELDKLLITDMKLKRPENFIVAAGLQGEKGSFTLTFPGLQAILELWKSSSEFGAMRSLTMVSLAQRMLSLCNSSSAASSALAAFYTRNFAEKIPDIKPPLLQLLVSFWQDESEHVRMAARSLFHCAASRAIPLPIRSPKAPGDAKLVTSLSKTGENKNNISNTEASFTNGSDSDWSTETPGISPAEESKILAWIESYEVQDWISCVGGTSQDAMTSHIIVAAALSIWYPSLVKPALAMLVVHPLIKLVMATNEKYSSTAAELLAEGMESTWKTCIGSEIPHLIADIFFQIECVSGSSVNSAGVSPAVPASIRETLVGTLLPSLAVADILGFLTFVESQIWSTASDSPVHLVSLMTIIRVARGSPRNLVQYVEKVVNFILQTMDPGNAVMRRTCLQTSMTALKEVVRVFPMVALNDTLTKLAVGDAIGEIKNASIRVYDVQSVTKLKVLDASGPPGLPSLLAGASDTVVSTAISALSFSPDGEGLVAFSEHGLMIRWWSLGSVWWEKLSRNLAPVQCTKLIFVPPWEGFSPNSSRSSIMASVMGHDKEAKLQENARSLSYSDSLKSSIHNLDLYYRLEWVGQRKILLTRHGLEVGTFQL